ncbi:N-acetylmuramoyl-L-alanine amidase CwlD [Ammoniphilus oxalaticus]|uniref:N-acetylmuramoyl-L-alanine amidase CwlD n=1 Tax=Ammoniphilus oxalaticus TaxID=66863 RepID=A0A419SFX8_9BACL|nr:N-acetylmuramoyl-L-alanine amidase CwlD [Ammoniphilus oxalaticus]RKD22665.1 N-acetylmuramoyl-L-alanine amidase CwlD [Ammoniphilus oxalaticus]
MLKRKKALLWLACFLLLISILTYEYPENNSWTAWSLPLSGAIIAIDPGHGGFDGGAVSRDGLIEKDVALDISLYLRDFLQQAGALVIMTREEDVDLSQGGKLGQRKREDIHRRVKMVNESEADMMVSIHLNAIPSPRWYGAQTFYFPSKQENQTLAFLIQDEIKDKLENTDRFAKKIGNVYLLKNVEMTAALVEVGFLSNPGEAAKLSSVKYQKSMANAIYQGILRYYSDESIPDSEYVE